MSFQTRSDYNILLSRDELDMGVFMFLEVMVWTLWCQLSSDPNYCLIKFYLDE